MAHTLGESRAQHNDDYRDTPSSPSSSTAMLASNDFHTRRDAPGTKAVAHEEEDPDAGNPTFADELFAPVTEWADTMRWSRTKPAVQQRRRWLIVSAGVVV